MPRGGAGVNEVPGGCRSSQRIRRPLAGNPVGCILQGLFAHRAPLLRLEQAAQVLRVLAPVENPMVGLDCLHLYLEAVDQVPESVNSLAHAGRVHWCASSRSRLGRNEGNSWADAGARLVGGDVRSCHLS